MSCCGTSHQQHTRLGFFSISITAIIFGMICLYYGEDIMSFLNPLLLVVGISIDCTGEKEAACLGIYTVFRESFALALFYLFMLLGSISSSRLAQGLNRNP
jgi:hypothetical protein